MSLLGFLLIIRLHFSTMESFYVCSSSFSPSPSFSSRSSSSNECIRAESWLIAIKTAQEILSIIEPTEASERRRWEVFYYVQNLIGGYLVDQVRHVFILVLT